MTLTNDEKYVASPKLAVIDTSALLTNGTKILEVLREKFQVLVVPICVVKELEYKRTDPVLGFLARDWLRVFELLRTGRAKDYGIEIVLQSNHTNQKLLPESLRDGSVDSTVLAVAKNYSVDLAGYDVTVLTNDLPMRLYASTALNLNAEEIPTIAQKKYNSRVSVVADDDYYAAVGTNSNMERYIKSLIQTSEDGTKTLYDKPLAHNCLIDFEGSDDRHRYYIKTGDKIKNLKLFQKIYNNITPCNPEQAAMLEFLNNPNIPLVSVAGSAGTGKTLITLASAFSNIGENKPYEKIIVLRSLHEMGAGQEIGFIPGNLKEKMAPWSGAVFDAIDFLERDPDKNKLLRAKVEVLPITFLRGRSLANSVVILDEAQNFSRPELLNIITRIGEGSKGVLCFDSAQVDNRFIRSGQAADIWKVVDELKDSELFAHITLREAKRSKVSKLAADILAKIC